MRGAANSSGGVWNVDVPEAAALGFAPRQIQHDGRPIDRRHRAGALRQRQREPAQAAAVLERRHRRELRRQAGVDDAEHPRHEGLAAREELALVLGREVGAEELRVGDDREVRLARRERLPARVGASKLTHWRLKIASADSRIGDCRVPIGALLERRQIPIDSRQSTLRESSVCTRQSSLLATQHRSINPQREAALVRRARGRGHEELRALQDRPGRLRRRADRRAA